jgi:hypothetical protein
VLLLWMGLLNSIFPLVSTVRKLLIFVSLFFNYQIYCDKIGYNGESMVLLDFPKM